MDDSIYGEDSTDEPTKSKESVDEEASANPTALLPVSALGGKSKPGDMVMVKVIKLHGDEVEVEISQSREAREKHTEMMEYDELSEMEV